MWEAYATPSWSLFQGRGSAGRGGSDIVIGTCFAYHASVLTFHSMLTPGLLSFFWAPLPGIGTMKGWRKLPTCYCDWCSFLQGCFKASKFLSSRSCYSTLEIEPYVVTTSWVASKTSPDKYYNQDQNEGCIQCNAFWAAKSPPYISW